MSFDLISKFKPAGDQPEAIKNLCDGIHSNIDYQTLLGVTGSGKTFTIANVIKEINQPTLILSHNKTLAAQLFSEFKQFFPNNAVEYFVSYYDYYQPEAYIPSTGLYIEKDLSINEEIEKYRLNTTTSLLSGRKDIIVVSSVSCIYGIGNPDDFYNGIIHVTVGDLMSREKLLQKLVNSLYHRTTEKFTRGSFRVLGDTVDIFLAHTDLAYRIIFFGNEIEEIESFSPENGKIIDDHSSITIYPANIFMTSKEKTHNAIKNIQDDLVKRIDYFPKNYLTVIDESHVTIPQIRAMFGGDKSRKTTLVEHGFRLPAAMDNRPLTFDEFELISNQTIYVSATPSDFELERSNGIITEQILRPTGLLDPKIEVRDSKNQVDDLLNEINLRIEKKERILVTTLTKRMAEEFNKYLHRFNIKCSYIHSDVDTLERVEILHGLKEGKFDVLIGVNLLREGLDLPQVSLVAIMDADKEGFLRSEKSLTQTAGRAARNINGLVIMYAKTITKSMKNTIDKTSLRRKKQLEFNKKHNIIPKPIIKKEHIAFGERQKTNYDKPNKLQTIDEIKRNITIAKKEMQRVAKELNFVEAARIRDEIINLEKQLNNKKRA